MHVGIDSENGWMDGLSVSLSGPTREQMEAGVPGAELRDREWDERGEESRDRKLSAEVSVM